MKKLIVILVYCSAAYIHGGHDVSSITPQAKNITSKIIKIINDVDSEKLSVLQGKVIQSSGKYTYDKNKIKQAFNKQEEHYKDVVFRNRKLYGLGLGLCVASFLNAAINAKEFNQSEKELKDYTKFLFYSSYSVISMVTAFSMPGKSEKWQKFEALKRQINEQWLADKSAGNLIELEDA